jgi:putative FmdB family regulatory protein
MPTYDYVCSECGYRFEEFQQMKDEPLKICPQCHKETVRRLIGGGNGFLFKGSGFYTTDYRNSGYEKAKKADTTPSGSSKSESANSKTVKSEAA